MKKKLKLVLNVLLVVVIFGVIFYVVRTSMESVFQQLAQTNLAIIFLVVWAGLLFQLIEGANIQTMIQRSVKKFSIYDGFWCSCYTAFMRVITFGAGTIVAEVLYYRDKGLASSKGFGLVSLRMIFYKAALIIFSIVGLIFFGPQLLQESPSLFAGVIAGIVVTFLIIAGLLALSLSITLQTLFAMLANKMFKSEKWRDRIDELNLKVFSIREMVLHLLQDRSILIKLILLNLGKLFFWFIVPWLVFQGETASLGFFECFFYTAFASILAGIIPTPAGLGSLEFVFTLLFRPLVGQVAAISALLLYRFATYVLPFLLGLGFAAYRKRRSLKQEVQEIKEEHSESK